MFFFNYLFCKIHITVNKLKRRKVTFYVKKYLISYCRVRNVLPDFLDIKQKENKIRKLLYSVMKRDNSNVNQFIKKKPVWKKFI